MYTHTHKLQTMQDVNGNFVMQRHNAPIERCCNYADNHLHSIKTIDTSEDALHQSVAATVSYRNQYVQLAQPSYSRLVEKYIPLANSR